MGSVDVEGLFRKFQVGEIRDIEKKVKGDIEQKKEDLRQMVGRRYRDIIETADSIRDMKLMADNILVSLRDVHVGFDRLEKLEQQLATAQQRAHLMSQPTFSAEFVTQVQLKLLLECPEMIWECLDLESPQSLLPAVWCLLFAESLHNSLSLQILPDAPKRKLVDEQLITIKNLRNILKQRCKWTNNIGQTELDCDCLCASLLLYSLTIQDLLEKVLHSQKERFESIFSATDTSSREQICQFMSGLQLTLIGIDDIFVKKNDKESQLISRLNSILKGEWQPEVFTNQLLQQSRAFQAALPNDFRKFRPTFGKQLNDIEQEKVTQLLTNWITECFNLGKNKLVSLLEYFQSIDALSALKKSVRETLENTSSEQRWRQACNSALGYDLGLWEALIKELITQRIKTLIQDNAKEIFGNLTHEIMSLKEAVEFGNFLWKELGTDVPIFKTASHKEISTLTLKARCVSAPVYRLCQAVDSQLLNLRKSIENYLHFKPQVDQFVCSVDPEHLWQALNEACAHNITSLASELEKNRLSAQLDSLIHMSMLCIGLCELCPSVTASLSWQTTGHVTGSRRIGQEAKSWQLAKTALTDAMEQILRKWADHVLEISQKEANFIVNLNEESWLEDCQEWESIDIEEEAETGKKVVSKLFVPVQISRQTHRFMTALVAKLGSLGVYRFPKSALQHLVNGALVVILDNVDQLLSCGELRQKQAIQLLFDCKIIFALLASKANTEGAKRATKLTEKLESFIDPFDMDVLRSHIKININKTTRKLMCLYGVLVLPETAQTLSRGANVKTAAGSEQPQLLPLNSGIARFQLLPVASPADYMTPKHKPLVKLASSSISTVSSVPSFSPETKHETYVPKTMSTASFASFYDKISSTWFGN